MKGLLVKKGVDDKSLELFDEMKVGQSMYLDYHDSSDISKRLAIIKIK